MELGVADGDARGGIGGSAASDCRIEVGGTAVSSAAAGVAAAFSGNRVWVLEAVSIGEL